MRLVAESGHFAQPEVNVGIIPGAGGTQRLPRLIGSGRAAELVLSGRAVRADEAVAIGLANAALPDGGFVDAVVEWAAAIVSKPLSASAVAKQAMLEGLSLPLAEALQVEGRLFIGLQTGREALDRQRGALDRYESAGCLRRSSCSWPDLDNHLCGGGRGASIPSRAWQAATTTTAWVRRWLGVLRETFAATAEGREHVTERKRHPT